MLEQRWLTRMCLHIGKSTLLDLLAGRKTMGELKGDILFSGVQPTRAFLRRYTGALLFAVAPPLSSLALFQRDADCSTLMCWNAILQANMLLDSQ